MPGSENGSKLRQNCSIKSWILRGYITLASSRHSTCLVNRDLGEVVCLWSSDVRPRFQKPKIRKRIYETVLSQCALESGLLVK